MRNVLKFLENSAICYPDKVGFSDESRGATFMEVMTASRSLGSALSDIEYKSPVAIIIGRNIKCIEAMFGAVYAGGFYTVIDTNSPKERIVTILDSLKPEAVITDTENLELTKSIHGGHTVVYENAVKTPINYKFLNKVRSRAIDTDPLYVLFTSGSSGVPKGAVLSHRSVINYTEWVTKEFKFDSNTSFGSQTPLYFSMSVTDLFSTIKCGASYNMIPKRMFTFPVELIDYLNNKKINTIYWVPSAMGMVSMLDAFSYSKPKYMRKILFAGEVMPMKHLNYWRKHLPNCRYANLFGPTETTDICSFYVVDRRFADDESLPIGKACTNCDCFVLDENDAPVAEGEIGELIVRGSFLASGYYNNPCKTAEAFVQNPLNKEYPEIVYRTGDLVKVNERGEFIYVSRKDFQIKRQGYRIELGEIETSATAIKGIKAAAAIFDSERNRLALYFESSAMDTNEFAKLLRGRLADYMYPDKIIWVDEMPYNANGKIDRRKLKDGMI